MKLQLEFIRGWLFSPPPLHAISAGFGPTVMNSLADAHGSDKTLFRAGAQLLIFSAPMMRRGRHRKFDASF